MLIALDAAALNLAWRQRLAGIDEDDAACLPDGRSKLGSKGLDIDEPQPRVVQARAQELNGGWSKPIVLPKCVSDADDDDWPHETQCPDQGSSTADAANLNRVARQNLRAKTAPALRA